MVKDERSLSKRIEYYTMIFLGPLIVLLSSSGISGTVLYYIVLPLYNSYFLLTIFLTIVVIIPLVIANGSLIYSAIIDPGSTNYIINSTEYRNNVYVNDNFISSLPKCEKCGLPKPARAHHCSTCGKCHLKMDHHCPVIGKCIALRNQQPFFVACIWATLTSFINVVFLLIGSFFVVSKEERTKMLIFTALTFVLFLLFFGFVKDSLNNIKMNITTIELMYAANHPYNLGEEENLFQVFGEGAFRMWWPKVTDFCGFEWSIPEYDNQIPVGESFNFLHQHTSLGFQNV